MRILNFQCKIIQYTNAMDSYYYKHKNLILTPQSQYQANTFRIFVASYQNSNNLQQGFYVQAFNFYDDLSITPVNYNINGQFKLLSTKQAAGDIPLGLLLGEGGSHLYLMHYQFDSVMVSKIDATTGAVPWTYSYLHSSTPSEASFARKQFLLEDVIIGVFAHKSSSWYTRIMRLIIDPNTSEPKDGFGNVWYDPSGFFNRFELLGIYIDQIDQQTIFFYSDDSNVAGCPCMYQGMTFLAQISPRINVKRRMSMYPGPNTSQQNILAFVINNNRYYLGANGKSIYSQDVLMNTYSYNQGFIMASQYQESCQQHFSDSNQLYYIQKFAETVNKLTSYVPFQNEAVSFSEPSIITSDLVLTALSSKSSWCTQNPFIFSSQNKIQPVTPQKYGSGIATELESFDPFTVNIRCSSAYSNVPQYQLMSYYQSPLPTYVSLNNARLGIDVSTSGPLGIYNLRIIAIFPNRQWYDIFTSIKGESAPYIDPLQVTGKYVQPISVHLSNTIQYAIFPKIIQITGTTASVSINQLAGGVPLPSPCFLSISADTKNFEITTGQTNFALVGTYDFELSVYITVSSVKKQTDYNVVVNILNDQPVFNNLDQTRFLPSLQLQNISLNTTQIFDLKMFSDAEGHTVGVGGVVCDLVSVHPFTAIISGWKISILSTSYTDLHKTHALILRLKDGQLGVTGNYYTSMIQFKNLAPQFSGKIQTNHTMKLNSRYNYTLPQAVDPENATPLIQGVSLPSFIQIVDQKYLIIEPIDFSLASKPFWLYKISVSDQEPLSTFYELNITYTNTAPRFMGDKPKDQKVPLNKKSIYTLPQYYDEEGHSISTVYQGSLSFVTLSDKTFTFEPTQETEVAIHSISGYFTDDVTDDSRTYFSFKVEVTNEAPYFEQALVDQTVIVNDTCVYQFPRTSDKEDHPVTISLTYQGQRTLPAFMKQLGSDEFSISPTLNTDAGIYPFMIALSDSVKATPPRFYSWKLTVLQRPKLKNITVDMKTTQVAFKIQQVTNYGEVVLKFTTNVKEFHEMIGNQTFVVRVAKGPEMRYRVMASDWKIGEAKLFIEYPQGVSEEGQEKIEIATQEEIIIQSSKNIIIMSSKLKQIANIPPQVSKKAANLGNAVSKATQALTNAVMPVALLMNLFLSVLIQYLWGLLSDLSFMTILSLVSISVPGISSQILSSLLNFIYLDVLMSEKWFVKIFYGSNSEGAKGRILDENSIIQERDQPLNQYFDVNGFSSKTLIKNLGSTFIYLLIYCIGYLVLYFCNIYLKNKQSKKIEPNPKVVKVRTFLHEHLFWNSSLRFILQQYPPLMISSLINLYYLHFGTFADTFCSIVSILMIIGLLYVLIAIYKRLKAGYKKTDEDAFFKECGTLVEGCYVDGIVGHYWSLITLVRWTVTVIVLVISRNYPEFQIFCLLITSSTFQILLYKGKPYADMLDNKLALFNETMVSVYLYILLGLTDYNQSNPTRIELGWALVISIFLSVFVNFMKFFYRIGVELIRSYRRRRAEKYRIRKEQAKLDLKKEGVTLVNQEINPYAYAFDNQPISLVKDRNLQSTLQMLYRVPFHGREQTSDLQHIPKLNIEVPQLSEYEVFMQTFKKYPDQEEELKEPENEMQPQVTQE